MCTTQTTHINGYITFYREKKLIEIFCLFIREDVHTQKKHYTKKKYIFCLLYKPNLMSVFFLFDLYKDKDIHLVGKLYNAFDIY